MWIYSNFILFTEHDFRSDNTRRVTFKSNKQGRFDRNQKDWTDSIRAHLADEDIDMGNTNMKNIPNKKFMKKYRSDSPMPHMKGNFKRKLLEGPIGWYRITLPYGNKYDKQYILKTFLDKLNPLPFQPITWQVNGNACTFYVDDYKVAEKLNNMDKEIQLPDGFRLMIKVATGCPTVDVNAAMKEKMKLAMVKRYSSITKALDLTRFHADPDLTLLFCALFKPIILLAVIDIIAENIPDIEAINLSENKIQMLSHLKRLAQKLPNLKVLHLGNNKIKDVAHLDSLMGLNIVDLVLDGNPLCDKFKDQPSYIR
ncbi:nuclear rna export factor [Holotrichia oblita]|uniref:Nuclear rna export factor n=1 Tax=Holotrichia oblita TaxID=644536 RepID=A0ACB9SKQ2_HOLOL|nr:nuclear rna export factor [Holotrichia oblita]